MSLEIPREEFSDSDVVGARVSERRTGARWQRAVLARLERHAPREAALRKLVVLYLAHAASGRPVHEWASDGRAATRRFPHALACRRDATTADQVTSHVASAK